MKYFEVETKCGHVGKQNCIYIKFAVIAQNGKQAAKKARQFGRVKHDHKDAIRNVREISKNEYNILLWNNRNDKYLQCKSRYEQNQIDIFDRLEVDERNVNRNWKKGTRNVGYKLLKDKIKERSSFNYLVDCCSEVIV